jgi:hypothetical protein
MKCNSIATSSLVVLSLLLTAAGAHAQSAIQAHVPFAFKVGTAQMPAGTYSMKKESDTNIVSIRNLKTNVIVLAIGTGQSPYKTADKLVFRHLGSQYFLTEIWGTKGTQGMVFLAPRRNSELQAASRPSNAANTVEIAAK